MCDLATSQFGFSAERLLDEPTTLEEIKQAVRESDDFDDEDSKEFKAAVILLSSAFVDPTIKSIHAFTRYPKHFVSRIYHNLRRNGIWGGGSRGKSQRWINADPWMDEEGGNIAFWLDVLCGLGQIERVEDRYHMAEET